MNPNFLLSVENVLSVASRGARNAVKEKHPLDMTTTANQPFDFGLTRPTIMKMEKQRQLLHYLRLEQIQFKDLGASALHAKIVPPTDTDEKEPFPPAPQSPSASPSRRRLLSRSSGSDTSTTRARTTPPRAKSS